jgi:16S rRNA (cytosine967-C5)-methyltransferase
LAALNGRAPLDLRVNTLCARRDGCWPNWKAGICANPCPHAPAASASTPAPTQSLDAGRLPCRTHRIQDEGSQLAVALADAKSGDTVIDLAAGAGGKSQALAAAMENRGRVFACDIEPIRLRKMEPRVIRAGITIIDIVGDPYGGAISTAAGGRRHRLRRRAVFGTALGGAIRKRNGRWIPRASRASAQPKPNSSIVPLRLRNAADASSMSCARFCRPRAVNRSNNSPPATQAGASRKSTRLTPARDGTDGFFAAVLGS